MSTGNSLLVVAPGQRTKLRNTVQAIIATREALTIDNFVIVAREMDPREVRRQTASLLHEAGVRDDASSLTFDVIDGVNLTDQELTAAITRYSAGPKQFHAMFTPFDRYVLSTSEMSHTLVEAGVLQSGRHFLHPAALRLIIDKSGFRYLMEAIDPDRTALHQVFWKAFPLAGLHAEQVIASFRIYLQHLATRVDDESPELRVYRDMLGDAMYRRLMHEADEAPGQIALDVLALPLRGACGRGVVRTSLATAAGNTVLSGMQGNLVTLKKDPKSGVTESEMALIVERVRGREFAIEVKKQGDRVVIEQIHKKADMGDASDPDGLFERIYVGTMVGRREEAEQDPVVRLLTEKATWMLSRLTEIGYDIGDGVFHLEARLDVHTGKVYFIELNPRPGGSKVPELVQLATDGALNLYVDQVYTSLRAMRPAQDVTWRPAGDLTLFVDLDDGDQEAESYLYRGFWMAQTSGDGSEWQYVGRWNDTDVLAELQRRLALATFDDAVNAYRAAMDLHYHVPMEGMKRVIATVSAQADMWQGVQIELTAFERFEQWGRRFSTPVGFYLGNLLALAPASHDADVAEFHLVAGLKLCGQYLKGRAMPWAQAQVASLEERDLAVGESLP